MELPSSELELELNCLKDFVPDSELELILPELELELNCKDGIDPDSVRCTRGITINKRTYVYLFSEKSVYHFICIHVQIT